MQYLNFIYIYLFIRRTVLYVANRDLSFSYEQAENEERINKKNNIQAD